MTPFDCIVEIEHYTKQHPELLEAHHFLFNLPLGTAGIEPEFIVIGVNPGENAECWKVAPGSGHEESSRHDFHKVYGGRPRNTHRWTKLTEVICGTLEVIFSEVFFWSSSNSGEAFEERFGKRIWFCTEHLSFCRDMNFHLVNYYKPRAVILPGLTSAEAISNLYGLRHKKTHKAQNGHRLMEHFVDKSCIPWVFTKHWSGAHGFTKEQKGELRRLIGEL